MGGKASGGRDFSAFVTGGAMFPRQSGAEEQSDSSSALGDDSFEDNALSCGGGDHGYSQGNMYGQEMGTSGTTSVGWPGGGSGDGGVHGGVSFRAPRVNTPRRCDDGGGSRGGYGGGDGGYVYGDDGGDRSDTSSIAEHSDESCHSVASSQVVADSTLYIEL